MIVFLLVWGFLFCATAYSQENNAANENYDTIEALIDILREKGVLSDREASKFLQRYKREGAAKDMGTVITIIPEKVEKEQIERIKNQVAEEVKKDLQKDIKKNREDLDYMSDELLRRSRVTNKNLEDLDKKVSEDLASKVQKSSWAQRIRWGGDVRLRYQGDFLDKNNAQQLDPSDPTELLNTQANDNRFRYRVRLSVKARIIDDQKVNVGKVDAAVRIATGNETNPISTNDTFGDYFNKDTITLDQAYLQWTYRPEMPIKGKVPEVSLIGGRIPNPWFYTNLLWDEDLNFEGVALNFLTDTQMSNAWKGFLTAGAFPLQYTDPVNYDKTDKYLYGGQVGLEYNKVMGLSTKVGLAYYDYKDIQGRSNDPFNPGFNDWTAPLFQTKGNTLFDIDPGPDLLLALASDYNLLNLTAQLDYGYWFPIHIIFTVDYVKNLGFDKQEVARLTGNPNVPEDTEGYNVGLLVGHPEPRYFGEWNLTFNYKYVGADAVLDAFTDSDFHLGGTNAKGWILGASMAIYRDIWLRSRWYTSNEISGPPLSIDVLQVDLNAVF
jgi:hypothetical protein